MPAATGEGPVPDLFASSSMAVVAAPPRGQAQANAKRARRSYPDDDYGSESAGDDPFADPSAWARPHDAGFRLKQSRKGRRVRYREPRIRFGSRRRPLFLALLLLVLVGGGLVALLRPGLCPHHLCQPIRAAVAKYVPGLAPAAPPTQTPATPAPLSASPDHLVLQVASGASQAVTLTLTNTGTAAAAWQGTTDLSWLSGKPASGSLAGGGTVKVTVTASPPSSLKPGSYTAKLVFAVGVSTMTVPVTITVTG
jgi:hypothetical protein